MLIVIFLFLIFYATFITLQTADLGRHIVNGRELLAGNTQLLYTNFYSYAQATEPFVNHHWLFGVIAYEIEQSLGFSALTVFNILLNTSGFIAVLALSIMALSQIKTKIPHIHLGYLLAASAFLSMPFFTHRLEVRPESVSLFLFALFYLGTECIRTKIKSQNKLTSQLQSSVILLIPLLLLQLIWTNTHLFFILGPLLFGYQLFLSLIEKSILKQKNAHVLFWLITTVIFFTATLVSPHNITGALAPFQIFDSYAYKVAENQSTPFLISYGTNNTPRYLYALFTLGILSLLLALRVKQKNFSATRYLLLAVIFAILGNYINRMLSFFGVVLLPALYISLVQIYEYLTTKKLLNFENSLTVMFGSTISIAVGVTILFSGMFLPKLSRFGFGLMPGTAQAADFITSTQLQGPFYNNYDNGGYFVYYLYPTHQPLIDNRPEAYSPDFLQNEYLKSVQNESAWKEFSEKYQLNAIFFYRHDQIDGAQQFLYNRVVDPEWVPVFVDSAFLIFAKNTPQNADIISEFEIPQEVFNLSN